MTTTPKWARIWRGRTRAEDFEAYSAYLHANGVRKIEAIPGNLGVTLLRRRTETHAEFEVISLWPSLDAIKAFAGDDITLTRHLPDDKDWLLELPKHVMHFEIYG